MPYTKTLTCDLCGSEDMGEYLVLRGKKRWFSWMECGYNRIKIYICETCQKKIKEAATFSRKETEDEQ
nr:MAG TPA: nucleic-acid-binding protein [Caudoviricetes sp.]